MTPLENKTNLNVYFDGRCWVCSKEIEHYAKVAQTAAITYVDLFDPCFDAAREGLDPVKIHRELHVKRPDGHILTGVDAFVEIWRTMGKYAWLSRIIQWPGVYSLAKLFYVVFAYYIRPMLPQRKTPVCLISPRKDH